MPNHPNAGQRRREHDLPRVLIHLMLILIAVGAGWTLGEGVRRYMVAAFVDHSGDRAETALELVDAFVATYAAERTRLSGEAVVPATFRAHALGRYAKVHDARLERDDGRHARARDSDTAERSGA